MSDIDDIKKLQQGFTNKIREFYQLAADNYIYSDNRDDHDRYLTIDSNQSISDKAKLFIALRRLDQMYDPKITLAEAKKYSKSVNLLDLEFEAQQLSDDPTFKKYINENGLKAFSALAELERMQDPLYRELKDAEAEVGALDDTDKLTGKTDVLTTGEAKNETSSKAEAAEEQEEKTEALGEDIVEMPLKEDNSGAVIENVDVLNMNYDITDNEDKTEEKQDKKEEEKNISLHDARKFVYAQMVYAEGYNNLLNKLKEVRGAFLGIQSEVPDEIEAAEKANPEEAIAEASDAEGIDAQKNVKNDKGLNRITEMKAKLLECIEVMEKGAVSQEELKKVLKEYQETAKNYYKENNNPLFKTRDKSKKERLAAALDSVKTIPVYINCLEHTTRSLDVFAGVEGRSFAEMDFNQIDEKARKLVALYGLEEKRNLFLEGNGKIMKNPEITFKNIYDISEARLNLLTRLKRMDKEMVKAYKKTKSNEDYLAEFGIQSVKKQASHFVTKSYLDVIYKPNVSLKELTELDEKLSKESFEKDIKEVSDSMFGGKK
ncbi:MAG: hypothetical protein K6C35_05820 [Eubacterium sp.]|nr:hypothetical protein [Eubacterium sp.]